MGAIETIKKLEETIAAYQAGEAELNRTISSLTYRLDAATGINNEGWRGATENLQRQLAEREADCINLRETIEAEIKETRRLELQLREANSRIRNISKDIFKYQKSVDVLLAGVDGWLDAFADTSGFNQGIQRAVNILRVWVTKRGRDLEPLQENEDGTARTYSDIPF